MSSYLTSILIGLLLINAWMYFQQPNMIFFPFKAIDETPADWGLDFEDVSFATEDGLALSGWYLPAPDAERVLLFFHGNGGNISHRGPSLALFHRLGLNVLIVDYRGYGNSEGSPSESGLYMDAMAAWSYLINEKGFTANEVVIFGRSLGGVVATNLASKVKASGLILESTFTSARDMASSVIPIFSKILVMRYGMNTDKHILDVHYPVLVLHSPDDDIVPFYLGKRVFELANEPKYFYTIRGSHNGGFYLSQPEYEQILAEWLGTL